MANLAAIGRADGLVVTAIAKHIGADRVTVTNEGDSVYDPIRVSARWPCGAIAGIRSNKYSVLPTQWKDIATDLKDLHSGQHGAAPCVVGRRDG